MSIKDRIAEVRTDAKIAAGLVKDGFSDGAFLVAFAIVAGALAIAVSVALVAAALR